MEDYIVIILTIIILVFGAIGRSKRKIPPQPQTQEPLESDDFWGVMEELGIPQPAPQRVVRNTEKVKIISVPEKRVTVKKEESSMLKNNVVNAKLGINEDNTAKSKRFSLREALIYSEILNRKYT